MKGGILVAGSVLDALRTLVSPYGVIGSARRLVPRAGEPSAMTWGCDVDWPERLRADPLTEDVKRDKDPARSRVMAAGSSWTNDGHAELTALAEGLERYGAYTYHPDAIIQASANELGSDALDLSLLPRLSDDEYARPGQVLTRPDTGVPIRWAAAWSLTDHRRVYVPAITCWFGLAPENDGERIWLPVSTGFAVHTDVAAASVAALNECIERDALSVLWLRRLPVPRLIIDETDDAISAALAEYERSLVDEPLLFDATTELGIPTIYLVSPAQHHQRAAVMVGCATDLEPRRAVAKALREGTMIRLAASHWTRTPASPDDCMDVEDGAAWTGRPENRAAFDFLLDTPHERKLSELPDVSTPDTYGDLAFLVEQLRRHGLQVLAIEVTPDEARDIGFRAVRILVPELVPLSFRHTARYLGHPRVLDAHERLGYLECAELPMNPYPQPMA